MNNVNCPVAPVPVREQKRFWLPLTVVGIHVISTLSVHVGVMPVRIWQLPFAWMYSSCWYSAGSAAQVERPAPAAVQRAARMVFIVVCFIVAPFISFYNGSTMGMSMLRFFGLKLMPMRVTGRLPPAHFAA